jgi:hypothetical protein
MELRQRRGANMNWTELAKKINTEGSYYDSNGRSGFIMKQMSCPSE